jgi:hypothetical protein
MDKESLNKIEFLERKILILENENELINELFAQTLCPCLISFKRLFL